MIAGASQTNFGGETLTLLPQYAVHWERERTLFVADVHLGKAATFRARGVPVPSGGTARDLSRLTALLKATEATRLIVLGDLFHAKLGRTPEMIDAVTEWRGSHINIEMMLIRGNHDRAAGRVPEQWDMREENECYQAGPFQLMHHIDCELDRPSLAGHVHPVVHIQDYDRSCVRVPCFVQDEMMLMLPAFGTFTGGGAISPEKGRTIFLATGQRVVKMQPKGVTKKGEVIA